MIRQAFKSSYNIDINNLPTLESNLDQKRKLKKKNVPLNNVPINNVPLNNVPMNNVQNILPNAIQQQVTNLGLPVASKPRSKTEIYSPATLSTVGISPVIPQQFSSATTASSSTITNTPASSFSSSLVNNQSPSTQTITAINSSSQTISAQMNVAPHLNRQRKSLLIYM